MDDERARQEVARLATLDPLSYGRERKDAAKQLGVPLGTLDKAVKAARPITIDDGGGACEPVPANNYAVVTKVEGFTDLSPKGRPLPTCENAREALRQLGVSLRYDVFHDKILIAGARLSMSEFTDHAALLLRKYCEELFRFDPGKDKMFDACTQIAVENSFDPVLDYLNSLKWDGKNRLPDWTVKYLGAEDTKLNRVIGQLMLVALIRRAKFPGIKFDQIVVLEGPEGNNKSSLLRHLASSDENFSDQTILGLKDREQQERLRGRWVYEIAELSGMKKSEVEHVKAFASRTHDRARPAYGRTNMDMPRRCLITATTNDKKYLRSETGNRRFWPLQTGKIEVGRFLRDRDQILAEAMHWEALESVDLFLPSHLWASAAEQQKAREVDDDPWIDILAGLEGTAVETADGPEARIIARDILEKELYLLRDRITQQHGSRLASVMRKLGWEPAVLWVDGKSHRGYRRKVPSLTHPDGSVRGNPF